MSRDGSSLVFGFYKQKQPKALVNSCLGMGKYLFDYLFYHFRIDSVSELSFTTCGLIF